MESGLPSTYGYTEAGGHPLPGGVDEAYRLSIHASFDLTIPVVLISRTGNEISLESKIHGYLDPSSQHEVTRVVSKEQWLALRDLIEQTRFWEGEKPSERLGLDGVTSYFEGRRGGAYFVVQQWCPENGPFKKICALLLELAGLKGLDSW